MNYKIILITLLNLAVRQSIADSNIWCHASLKATNGTSIQVDYQVEYRHYSRMPDYWVMSNVYVHFADQRFSGTEKVSVVLLDVNRGVYSQQEIRALPFMQGRYTAHSQQDILIKSNFSDHVYSPHHFEIAVAIDDIWLKDPISGESNFKFFATDYPNYCSNRL